MPDQALSGIKVLDVSHHVAGPYCTKLMADMGAHVIKVERPDAGDPARRKGPFPHDNPNQDASGLFCYLNNNKQSITLNLKTGTGVKIFQELVKKADILVENFHPRVMPKLGLSYDSLKIINPGLVMTSISNFGQSGPYRDFKATDIVLQALGGWLWARGEPGREPVRAAGGLDVSGFIGGVYAATGTMTAYSFKIQTGLGQHVDISLMEAASSMLTHHWAQRMFPKNPPVPPTRFAFIPGAEQCKDGYIGINTLTGMQWVSICGMMGMEDWGDNPNYKITSARVQRRQEIYDRIHPWLMEHGKEEIFAEGQAWRVPVAPVYSNQDILNSPQHQAREYIVEVEHPVLGRVAQPGAVTKMTETPWQIRSPAPLLGEHNEKVYGELCGYNRGELVKLKEAGVI